MKKKNFYLGVLGLFMLNVIDAIYTIWLVGSGVAEEVNPVMKTLLIAGPWTVFFSTKMIVGTFFTVTIAAARSKIEAGETSETFLKYALLIPLATYISIVVKHFIVIYQFHGMMQ